MNVAKVVIEPLTTILVQLFGALILAFGTWAVHRLVRWLGLKNEAEITANYDAALEKAVTYGVQQIHDVIREKGWDSVEVKNGALAHALPYMVERFPDTLKAAGLELSNTSVLNTRVGSALDRMFPHAAAKAAASPATPPSTSPNPTTTAQLADQSTGGVTRVEQTES